MGLLLRDDAYCAESSDGMYVLNHEGSVTVPGKSAFALLERLSGFLDGNHDMAELTTGLSEGRQQAVRQLIAVLMRHGVVREVPPTTPGIQRAVQDEPEPEVRFLDYFVDSGADVFASYRAKSALVLGVVGLIDATASAAERSGLRNLTVVQEYPEDDEALATLLDGVDLVLHVGPVSVPHRMRDLDNLCASRGILLVQAILLRDQAWIARSDGDGFAATSTLLRLRACRGNQEHANREIPEVATTVIANKLVHDAFTAMCGVGKSAAEVHRVDMSTLLSEVENVVPHPYAREVRRPSREQFRRRVAVLQRGQRITPEAFSQRAAALRGSWTGVFTAPTEREFVQMPLCVSEITVSDPVGLLGDDAERPRVIGSAWDFATARHNAALKAVAVCASLTVDPRRTDYRGPTDNIQLALHSLRYGDATVFGQGLADDDVHRVRVTEAFPALRSPQLPYGLPPGVGVGYDWTEAVTAGLLGRCRDRTLREIPDAATPFPRFDVPERDRASTLLGVAGESVHVYDVTGTLGVPTALCYLGEVPAGCACALTSTGALVGALEEALLHHQAREDAQTEFLPPPTPAIPERLKGAAWSTRQEALDVSDVVRALARDHEPVAVPLDHDPEVHAIMPYVVHVVFADA